MENKINLQNLTDDIHHVLPHLSGTNPAGERLCLTNRYIEKGGKPFFGICGEFHFSRYQPDEWETELSKMKLGGVNIVPTYVIWNHHEEIKGHFDWRGHLDLRRFIKLCAKVGLYVILRIGPWDHGEARNGGFPDWLYGEPCLVRSSDPRYMHYVEILYKEIGRQVEGLFYQDGGPIIGVQLENEYCHAGASWEITTGTTNEWIPNGSYDGDKEKHFSHIAELKRLAIEAGMVAPLYTGTGWGGAEASLENVLPLWGGYAFWPWIFYDPSVKEHPLTPEYIYRDFRRPTYNFDPSYDANEVPYACCEMGGGMTVFYAYRFRLPYESVDAMTNIKIAGGCNFVGYYVYHGGSNPRGIKTPFLNETACPKISYDYQAVLGEFGQERPSYHRLRREHYFFTTWEETLCPMQTVLPEGAEEIEPSDLASVRYSVRTKDGAGFLFINNYQDHAECPAKKDMSFTLSLDGESIRVPAAGGIDLAGGESCILPFNMEIGGATLKYATAQPITHIEKDGRTTYFFFAPKGMAPEYAFKAGEVAARSEEELETETVGNLYLVRPAADKTTKLTLTTAAGEVDLYTLTPEDSLDFYVLDGAVLFTSAAISKSDLGLQLDSEENEVTLRTLKGFEPKDFTGEEKAGFISMTLSQQAREIPCRVHEFYQGKATISLDLAAMRELKDVLLTISYEGDIGYLFYENDLIADDYANGAPWETGLKHLTPPEDATELYLNITPIKKGAVVKSDSPMAARSAEADEEIVELKSITARPVYRFTL